MQYLAISMMRLFLLTVEYSTSVKNKMQMYNDGANKNEGNDYECQDVCNHAKHIIPHLSLFVARSQIIDPSVIGILSHAALGEFLHQALSSYVSGISSHAGSGDVCHQTFPPSA